SGLECCGAAAASRSAALRELLREITCGGLHLREHGVQRIELLEIAGLDHFHAVINRSLRVGQSLFSRRDGGVSSCDGAGAAQLVGHELVELYRYAVGVGGENAAHGGRILGHGRIELGGIQRQRPSGGGGDADVRQRRICTS